MNRRRLMKPPPPGNHADGRVAAGKAAERQPRAAHGGRRGGVGDTTTQGRKGSPGCQRRVPHAREKTNSRPPASSETPAQENERLTV